MTEPISNDTPQQPLPPGCRWQISSESFDFGIVIDSKGFQRYQDHAKKKNLIRDVCDHKLHDVEEVPIANFINIEQKSPTWFRFRAAADGTASSVGKKIKGSTMYPTISQVSESWHDSLSGKPFEITHTMAGHMKWGVGYEDPALVHFAVDNGLSVAQVGTIYLPLSYVMDTAISEFCDNEMVTRNVKYLEECLPSTTHLLVSPDGVVGEPDNGPYEDLPKNMLGMLEIKCISPFHYMEEGNKTLSWVDDMETRQWFHPGQIPYVYITQICLQAIAGIYRLDMTEDSTMWFIRWSPKGFSEFKISYGPLVRMGCAAIMLFFRLKQRLTLDQLPLVYTDEEQQLANLLHECYTVVCNDMVHRYVDHSRLYPEFDVYRRCTEYHRFRVHQD
jgi:hypothetical protein